MDICICKMSVCFHTMFKNVIFHIWRNWISAFFGYSLNMWHQGSYFSLSISYSWDYNSIYFTEFCENKKAIYVKRVAWCFSQSSCSGVSDSCDPVDCSTPGLPAHHQRPAPAQTHVHWVGDATHCGPLLLLLSILASGSFPNESALLQWVGSSYQVAKALEFHLQHQFFLWIFRIDFF